MGSAAGALKAAATRIGITVDEYQAHIAAGRKWCTGCKTWHPITAFRRDPSRTDGLSARCQESRNSKARKDYRPRPRPAAGRRFVPVRDGDQKQARRRVNHLVDVGLLPPPNTLPCTDCGHTWQPGQKRHEYDHHLGYAAQHHEHVEPVCTDCHTTRTHSRKGIY
ncbi:hypothetical protein [Streptomyces chartreusis]|uniref:hypothetical protein n=1 Tax=Streptomyces chartreusis TaxID=1969 RepID=UPI00386E32B1